VEDGQRWDNPMTGVVGAASEDVLKRIRDLADMFRSAGGGALGALGTPVPNAVGAFLSSLQRLVEQAPAPVEQLEMLLAEIAAKRALIGALHAQLTAFDRELAILEKSLQPLREWGNQWSQVQASLVDSMRLFRVPGKPSNRKPAGQDESRQPAGD